MRSHVLRTLRWCTYFDFASVDMLVVVTEKGSSDLEPQEFTSSRVLKKTFSIKELNSVVAEQLTKCLNALERNMVPGKAEHRRAIVLATLVAIVVWARNAKHLHEAMPRIRGAAINVHLRSRL